MPTLAFVLVALIALVFSKPIMRNLRKAANTVGKSINDARTARKLAETERKRSQERLAYELREKKMKLEREQKLVALSYIEELRAILAAHSSALKYEKNRHTQTDSYGNSDLSAWSDTSGLIAAAYINELENPAVLRAIVNSPSLCNSGFLYFWKSVLVPQIGGIEKFLEGWRISRNTLPELAEFDSWPMFLYTEIERCIHKEASHEGFSCITNVATGIKYELHCMEILEKAFWKVTKTAATGDQGIDLIAVHQSGPRVCIQCKYHEKPVGNIAVQEVVAGRSYYSGSHAAVVSESGFTKSAIDLAASTNVMLLSANELLFLLDKLR
jgi:restriction system protein